LGVLAAAEADFEPELRGLTRKGGFRVGVEHGREGEARQGAREQRLLAGAQLVAANPAVEAVSGGFGCGAALPPALSREFQPSRRAIARAV
jgi:hypothetical protein